MPINKSLSERVNEVEGEINELKISIDKLKEQIITLSQLLNSALVQIVQHINQPSNPEN